jgi:hypothetical protein
MADETERSEVWLSGEETGEEQAREQGADGGAGLDFEGRPEMLVGAAFVGGFALAQILKRLGR